MRGNNAPAWLWNFYLEYDVEIKSHLTRYDITLIERRVMKDIAMYNKPDISNNFQFYWYDSNYYLYPKDFFRETA